MPSRYDMLKEKQDEIIEAEPPTTMKTGESVTVIDVPKTTSSPWTGYGVYDPVDYSAMYRTNFTPIGPYDPYDRRADSGNQAMVPHFDMRSANGYNIRIPVRFGQPNFRYQMRGDGQMELSIILSGNMAERFFRNG